MARTVKVNGIPSYVTSDDFSRLFGVEGCLEARLMGRQAETGEQLGYVEFQDVASATKAIQQLQGHMGLGGKGLRLAPSTSTLSQLTGTPAAGTGAQKRPREENGISVGQQPQKQQRSEAPQPQQQPNVAALLQGLDPRMLNSLLMRPAAAAPQQTYASPASEVPPPPPPPPPMKPQQAPQVQSLQPPRSPLSRHPNPMHRDPGAAAPPTYQQYAPPPSTSDIYQPEYVVVQPQPTQMPVGTGAYVPDAGPPNYQQQQQDYQQYYAVPAPTQQYQQQAPPPQPTYQQQQDYQQYEPQYQQQPQQTQYQQPYQPQTQQVAPQQYGAPPAQAPPGVEQYAPQPQQAQQALPQQYLRDASKTLYTEGFPSDVSNRELAHIFRHFPGYLSLRVVIKDSKRFPGEKLCMAFIEFDSVASATEAMTALQGYVFDLDDKDSVRLHIKYARPMENPRAVAAAHGGGGGRGGGRGHGRGGGHRGGRGQHHRGGRHGQS